MAYSTYFPQTYTPLYYAQPQAQQVQNPQPQSSIIWVSGEAGAKAYLVAPNTTAQLWDSEKQCIYIKSADASGMPTMKILDYTIRENPSQGTPPAVNPLPTVDYVTKDELSEIEKRLNDAMSKIEKIEKEVSPDDEPFV